MKIEKIHQELTFHGLELIIGLETHIRLNTKTKLFCACPNEEFEYPNTYICSICTGQMGVLPAVNQEAIRKAIIFGKAIHAEFNEVISWDRKHYDYPDLPKNYQLTQIYKPIIKYGKVECFRENGSTFEVLIKQVHIEEDAAKLKHEKNNSLVDFNKAGVPLIEIVTQPCIQSIKDVSIYAQYLQRIAQNINISYANLEKGEFKSDVSVSLRKKGSSRFNTRTEIKNLNSFKFMIEALQEEVVKQLDYYIEYKTFRPDQTTVLWNEDLKQTNTMRKKEFIVDYRYLMEVDIPNVSIKSEIESIVINSEFLPFPIEKFLIDRNVHPTDAKFFTSKVERSQLILKLLDKNSNVLFITKTLLNNLNPEDYSKIKNPKPLIFLINQYQNKKITLPVFQEALKNLFEIPNFDVEKFSKNSMIDKNLIEKSVSLVINENKEIVLQIKEGNFGKVGILIKQVLQKVGKNASGKLIHDRILDNLGLNLNSETFENVKFNQKKYAKSENIIEFPNISSVIRNSYRTHTINQIDKEFLGKFVILSGWVSSIRDHGELIFIDLRDSSYEVFQIMFHRNSISNFDELSRIKPESVILVEGKVINRNEVDYNANVRTGTIELEAINLELLNISKTLPFEIKRALKTNENTRLTYKFLDHRNQEIRQTLINRHKVIKLIRDSLDKKGFLEVETPILTLGTDEGAREFIVPSRKFPGKSYALPQAPQQFKQMLMVGGVEKYFQIARCFRDEDSRGDRQPEFTQLDMELAYVGMQDIMNLNSELFNTIVKTIYKQKWKLFPFQIISYYDAMEKYGCDRPDLRFGLQMQTITEIVKSSTFEVFLKPIKKGGVVKCIKFNSELMSGKRITKKQIEKLTKIAKENGLGGLAYIIVNEDELQSPIIKYLGKDIAQKIIDYTSCKVGDVIFFSAADYETANKALNQVRQEIGKMFHLIKPNELHPVWIIDFPMFEMTEEGNYTFTHNPFSMPKIEDITKHIQGNQIQDTISQQYDFVLNGYEIGGGSIRAHKAEILEATYRNMGYKYEEMRKSIGHIYDAFQYGAPPHGGIAWGIDRLIMILEGKKSIREVIAYPKTGKGEDLLFGCPSEFSNKENQ